MAGNCGERDVYGIVFDYFDSVVDDVDPHETSKAKLGRWKRGVDRGPRPSTDVEATRL